MANIQPRGKNNYFFTVSLGRGPDGKYIRKTKTITVEEKMAPKKLRDYLEHEYGKFKAELESGTYITPGKKSLVEFIDMWRDNYAKSNLSPTTLNAYESHIQSRLVPTFGHLRLDQIKTGLMLDFLKGLEKPGARKMGGTPKKGIEGPGESELQPLDFGTIGYVYRVLKNILTRAVEWNMLASNPMDGIKKPGPDNEAKKQKQANQKKNPQYYNEEEAQLVVDALYKETRKWRLLILGSMIGGCRRGELNALEWPFVYFNEHCISVENNIPLTKKGAAIEKDPKSLSSIRTVDMPEWYMKELQSFYEEWKEEKDDLGDRWQGGERQFLFHNGFGKPYYYQHASKWWIRFCKRHNIRYIKFHGLRHSMGTLLIEDEQKTDNDIDSILMAIQKRLGHSRLSTSADIYVHVTKKVKKRTAGKFDKFGRTDTAPTPHIEEIQPPRLKRVK